VSTLSIKPQEATAALTNWVSSRSTTIVSILLLLLLEAALFSVTLQYVPANGDELAMLSSVSHTENPLSYFVGDWGLGNNAYRPLHSLSIWVSYRLFGVSSGANQLLNLILHFVAVCLLFKIVSRVLADKTLAFLLSAMALVSIYTVSSASWIADRPSLLVAIFLLLLVDHLLPRDDAQVRLNIIYIAALSVLALMSKESGMILPVLAIAAMYKLKAPDRTRWSVVITSGLVLVAYALLRIAIFGPNAAQYSERGYLFGLFYYDDWGHYQGLMRWIAMADTVARNLVAALLPVFDNIGAILSPGGLLKSLPIWLPTVLLVVFAVRRTLTRLQAYSLVILICNSAIHFVEFRYRIEYIPQFAVCLFIAGSPLLRQPSFRLEVAKALAGVLLLFSVLSVSNTLSTTLVDRYEELQQNGLANVLANSVSEPQARGSTAIDPRIVDLVLTRYRR
jgi:hypothetical protein